MGDAVEKPNGYPYPGIVVAAFLNRAGETRYVVESDVAPGMLHIFSPSQLIRREDRPDSTKRGRPVFLATAPSLASSETFAVACLNDGSEIRMRNLGDRVEVRGWDTTESCKPPRLIVTEVGPHVIDATTAPRLVWVPNTEKRPDTIHLAGCQHLSLATLTNDLSAVTVASAIEEILESYGGEDMEVAIAPCAERTSARADRANPAGEHP